MPDKLTNARKGKGEFGLFGKLSGGGRFFGSPSGRCFVAHFFSPSFHVWRLPGHVYFTCFSAFFGACEKRAPSAPHPLVGENPHPQMLHNGYSRKPGLMVMMLRTCIPDPANPRFDSNHMSQARAVPTPNSH